ncbi:alpha/beta hydrolase [cf. Phormidesmis sp. LEGE 11477]|uniref:alpha/beta hydrolase n=1 Tax=cf. Phormidesmis sp. LEGE 11477 TaxID=1828680 RepID=UPI00187F79D1|nr:alpha/beta hydrolase [cf. Phormidesmis sp. LEGE 11477]MBE9063690.1 alpha/beta hydrolase [cf. Phormidesmis sp. LEGE 11477]
MTQAQSSKGRHLLAIEEIPSASPTFPAYFVGSTAPNNVEDGVGKVDNPQDQISRIAAFLSAQKNPEILIVVHGYNTALGSFATARSPGTDTKGWYQDIRNHIAKRCDRRPKGLVLIGYRWPSEQINGSAPDTIGNKLRYALRSLPVVLKVVSTVGIVLLALAVIGTLSHQATQPVSLGIELVAIMLAILATFLVVLVLTLFLLRLVGYFRDSYRASNFGVPDLVELIRQIDKAVRANDPERDWSTGDRIKLSFIGHSMGGFVVTNAVRILSDVFDLESIGSLGTANKAKAPSSKIGNVFSLGRLVLVSPDIPAETIISGRANFLSSSLRRFEETYLFSNEGDMALKLASTAANYASFPARTQEGGYRLGNVVVRSPYSKGKSTPQYGIVNFDANAPTGEQLSDVQARAEGGFEPKKIAYKTANKIGGGTVAVSSFLEYLHTLSDTPLSHRQREILEPEQKPIAELFTVFDCTDYYEFSDSTQGEKSEKIGLLSYGLQKRSLNFVDYVFLTIGMIRGKVDTHSGYFCTGDLEQPEQPEAYVSKQLIYGLACLGFKRFLISLSAEVEECDSPTTAATKELQTLSQLCEARNIQVLLAAERYNRDVLGVVTAGDRIGY